MQDLTINGRPAPYRRDLTGADLRYEFQLMMAKYMDVDDVLIVPMSVIQRMGMPALGEPRWPLPPWPYQLFEDQAGNCIRIRRIE